MLLFITGYLSRDASNSFYYSHRCESRYGEEDFALKDKKSNVMIYHFRTELLTHTGENADGEQKEEMALQGQVH